MRPKQTGTSIVLSLNSAIAAVVLASSSPAGAQPIQTLYSFNNANGATPRAGLTLGIDGNFYGTTAQGGISNPTWIGGMGTVFKITTNGTLTTLVYFNGSNGAEPWAELVLDNAGNFYGTTQNGGSSGNGGQSFGTVFKVTTNGALTTLASFAYTNGATPRAGLTIGNDGNFYGTTYQGGSSGYGTVFRVTTNGTLTTLASFANTNGAHPWAGLTLGNDGIFYGTTYQGGSSGYGTVFKVTTNGTLTTLVFFDGANGGSPQASLTMGNDGNFYGTTSGSSTPSGSGTVFRLTTNSTLTTLVSGLNLFTELRLGTDGSFYGTAPGMVFHVTTNGTLTKLAGLNDIADAALAPGNDGSFYGTTYQGGSSNYGTVFCLLLPVITVQPQSQANSAGTTVIFFVSATSLTPMGYQWQKNGTNLVDGGSISGATTSTLTITSISDPDAAAYSTIVSNSYRSVTSSIATLTVHDLPVIASQPQSQTVRVGSNVTFNVTVSGASPFVFQWYLNGTVLGLPATGTNFSSCMVTNVQVNQAGSYSVEVVNGYGSVRSSSALLTVIAPPRLALEFWAGYPLLNLSGMLSSNFVVQYSTNLAGTNWVNLLSLTNLPFSPYLFLDPAGDSEPARFYRAFMR